MQGRGRITVIGVVLGVIGLVTAGCSSGGSSSGGGGGGGGGAASATTAAASGDNEIKLTAQNTSWNTNTLQLTSGAPITVEVTNKDTVEHNFTFEAATASKDVEGGEDTSLNFTAPAKGSYKFFCKYHPTAMTGTVTVT
jgi:plastocyanin